VGPTDGAVRYPVDVLKSLRRLGAAAARLPVPLVDGLLALGLLAATTSAGHSWTVPNRHEFDLRGIVLSAAVLLPLTFRRRHPLAVFGVSSVTYALYLAFGYATTLDFYGPLLAFATVSMFSRTRVTAYTCVLMSGLMFVGGLTTPGSPVLGSLFQALLLPGLAWTLGASIRGLSLRNRRLAELTTQLEGAQAQIAQRATIEERVRIARELHDAAAHHISVIGVQAELAWYVFDSDPQQSRESLGLIAEASREAVTEMRNLLTVLRTASAEQDDAELEYSPVFGLDRLPELVERVGTTGVVAEVEVEGARRPLSPGADSCAYRIVQEALTNVAKHASGADARVRLVYEPDGLRISVVNGAPPRFGGLLFGDPFATLPAQLRRGGAGLGLIGMRERAAICGGELEVGPRPGGGYAVVLRLPFNAEIDSPSAARISSWP
jgi:signal transduction histidine kinase